MSILIVGLVLLLVHLFGPAWPRLRHRILAAYFNGGFAALSRLRPDGRVGLVLLIAVAVLAVAAIQWQLLKLSLTWPWFLFSLVMLLLAWGSRDLDEDVRRYVEAADDEERRRSAEVLTGSYRAPQPTSDREAVVKGIFYQGLVRWFGVLFWFLVLGAAGATLFRLPHALLGDPANRALLGPRQLRLAQGLAAVLDLIPAALTTLSLAVVGNFDAVVDAWRQHFVRHRRSALALDSAFLPDVGYRTVCCDDGEAAFDADTRPDASRAMSLVWRALMAWLTVVALLIIAGLVS